MLDVDGHQVAQDERPGQFFVRDLVFERIGNYGHAHGDALVAAAAVTHGGQGAAGHTGIRGRGGHAHGVAHEIVPEHLFLVFADGLAHLQAVVAAEAFLRQRQVQRAVFQDKGNVLVGGLPDKVPDGLDSEVVGRFACFGRQSGGRFRAHEDFIREAGFHNAVVVVLDYRVGVRVHLCTGHSVIVHRNRGFYVKEVLRICHGNVHKAFGYQFFRAGHRLRRKPF